MKIVYTDNKWIQYFQLITSLVKFAFVLLSFTKYRVVFLDPKTQDFDTVDNEILHIQLPCFNCLYLTNRKLGSPKRHAARETYLYDDEICPHYIGFN